VNFCIFSIDDSRRHYTDKIRKTLGTSFWFNEVPVWTVDAGRPGDVENAQLVHNYRINWREDQPMRAGHLGIWYSVLNATNWNTGPVVTFEDDAVLHPAFTERFWTVTSQLPKDTDCFSLFLPRDQDNVYHSKASTLWVAGTGICKAYQVYGGVSMFWTKQGGAKFRNLIRRDGIQDQWDNQLYGYARAGEMNVYTGTPGHELVSITGSEKSIVQESAIL
jgi:hypothetical protein